MSIRRGEPKGAASSEGKCEAGLYNLHRNDVASGCALHGWALYVTRLFSCRGVKEVLSLQGMASACLVGF